MFRNSHHTEAHPVLLDNIISVIIIILWLMGCEIVTYHNIITVIEIVPIGEFLYLTQTFPLY